MRRAFVVLATAATMLVAAGGAMAQETAQEATCPARDVLDAAPQRVRAGDGEAIAQFQATAPCHYWITFYFAAKSLFDSGQRDEAVRWFYVAQLRGRTVAELDPNSTPSLIGALQYVVGQPINEYAGGDQQKLIQAIDWATAWDQQHPMTLDSIRRVGHHMAPGVTEMDFDPSHPLFVEALSPPPTQAQLDAAYADQRSGIASLRSMIADVSPADWVRQRRANGQQH